MKRLIRTMIAILCLAQPGKADPTSTRELARGCELTLALVSAKISANGQLNERPEIRWESRLFMQSYDDINRDYRCLFLFYAPSAEDQHRFLMTIWDAQSGDVHFLRHPYAGLEFILNVNEEVRSGILKD